MSTTIKVKKSGVTGNIPSNASLEYGELALNYADGILYYKNPSNVISFISGSVANTFETINANGTLIISDSNTDILSLQAGDGLHISGDGITDTVTFSVRFTDDINNATLNTVPTANLVNTTYAVATNSGNTVQVSANSGTILSNRKLNFINSASVIVELNDPGDGTANVLFRTSFASPGDAYNQANLAFNQANSAYSQANSAYEQANAAYNAANNAAVKVTANSGATISSNTISFNNTSTVSVSVTQNGSNANISFSTLNDEFAYNTSTTSAETIDSWSTTSFRSGKYQLQVSSSVGYLTCEIMMLHNGNNINHIQYSNISFGSSVGTFSTDISDGSARLRFAATDATTRIRYYRYLLKNDSGSDPEVLPTDLMTGAENYDLMNDLFITPTDLNA